jgi:molybdopterin-guanine dinucleotide biosynthesis protein A
MGYRMGAAVLAGGKASRFGSDKTRLVVDGCTLVSRLLAAQAQAGLGPLYLCAADAPPDLPPGVNVIADEVPGLGPLGALAGLLARVAGPVLVAAGDMPGLDAEAFQALAGAYDPDQAGLVARDARGWQPLLAVYSPALLPLLRQRLALGQRSLQGWVEAAGLPAWALPHPEWAMNLNRPEDWEAWRRDRGL